MGLRSRVTLAFTAGAAALSGALAGTTFGVVHHDLLNEQATTDVHQTYADARVVKRELGQPGANNGLVLTSVSSDQGLVALLYQGGKWYSGSLSLGAATRSTRPTSVPSAFLAVVRSGSPASQVVASGAGPALTVGVPLPAVHADFFEVFPLEDLSRTYSLLSWALIGCALATTAAGTLVGRWASRRLLRPLRDVSEVAASIAGGDLDNRLPASGDPDLAVLSSSFNEMVNALQERVKRDARFAADVSHELRSPLTTVQATVELLEASSDELSDPGRQALELLRAEVARLNQMVRDLLEISRIDTGASALEAEELDLGDLVVNTVEAYGHGAVPVTVEPPAEGTWVLADPRRLQRALVNLLDNAKAYGGGATEVKVGRTGREAVVTVDDAGPGVAPSERDAIFDRFYRGAAAGRRGSGSGSGLGLSLVAEHMKAHGGRVEVTDRPGGGARFIMRIPVVQMSSQVASHG